MLFSKYFINIVKIDIDIRALFMLYYKEWLDEKPKGLGESADNYKNRKEEVFEFEPNQSNLRVLLTYCMRSREKLSKPT